MSENVVVGGSTYVIPDQGDPPNWGTNLTPFFVALAANVASNPSFMQLVNAASTPITIVSGKTYLVASNSLAVTLNLPAPVQNFWFLVKDSGGASQTNAITIHRSGSQTIDGVASDATLANNYGFWGFMSDGTNWFSLNNATPANDLIVTGAGKGLICKTPDGLNTVRIAVGNGPDFSVTTEALT